MELYRQAGDERGEARVAWSTITVASEHPKPANREGLLEVLRHFERLGDTWFMSQTMMSIAWVELSAGDVATASGWFIRALSLSHSLRDVTGTTIALPLASFMAVQAGRPEEAAMILGASEHLSERYGVKAPLGLADLLRNSDPRPIAETMLGKERYADAYASGGQMTLDEVVALAVRVQEETWGSARS